MKLSRLLGASCFFALASFGAAQAAPVFSSTNDPSSWQVATNVGGTDGQFSSFPTSGFVTATGVPTRTTDGINWIANNATGTNGPLGTWTFFVFRQTFDLTGYDAATADLQFQWAADDSGEGFAIRGTWTPKFSLNGGALIAGSWPSGSTYDFGNVTDISTGFVSGLNTIDFYVEGNGVTDGFALKPIAFRAVSTNAVPEPLTLSIFGAGLAGAAALRRGRKTKKA